eukprot:1134762-Pelagomonas_calceolata.AAC.4
MITSYLEEVPSPPQNTKHMAYQHAEYVLSHEEDGWTQYFWKGQLVLLSRLRACLGCSATAAKCWGNAQGQQVLAPPNHAPPNHVTHVTHATHVTHVTHGTYVKHVTYRTAPCNDLPGPRTTLSGLLAGSMPTAHGNIRAST